jgi:hypothetical protein
MDLDDYVSTLYETQDAPISKNVITLEQLPVNPALLLIELTRIPNHLPPPLVITCMSVSSRHIAVGTSRGEVIMFDLQQNFIANLVTSSYVTAIDFTEVLFICVLYHMPVDIRRAYLLIYCMAYESLFHDIFLLVFSGLYVLVCFTYI